ncbi:hypothetical protein [Stackebrandtia nassauensis]|uniref:Uncharacterized protein n=1 Tax=Stackebrandtia nassauensis (strain DSM 44728 / CIP 108903 / NRRL B-16338 / NBRC 102104 / LLR-40K-21) TaxID=446470 RepID=D3Q9J4_STANL|nr:hypothetical protein [Stackebrandtia nassauensis]ADD42676.1 hypothetical protein Snas_3005 [Stackebrandtia nassauensis DSM 44728]
MANTSTTDMPSESTGQRTETRGATTEAKPDDVQPTQSDAEESQLTKVSHTVIEQLPDKRHLAYYAGLAGLAAFGVMSWPTARGS